MALKKEVKNNLATIQLLAELKHIGNNINQLAKVANSTRTINLEDMHTINSSLSLLRVALSKILSK